MSVSRGVPILTFLSLLAAVVSTSALEGMILLTDAPQMYVTGSLRLRYLSDSTEKTLYDSGVYGPSFSPDGRQVAAMYHKSLKINVTVVGIDGVPVRTLATYRYATGLKEPYATWAEDGYIYWSNCDQILRRVAADGSSNGVIDTVYVSDKNIHNVAVSMDGTRAVWTCPPPNAQGGNGWSNRTLDLNTLEMYETSSGCQSTISPDGVWITKSAGSHRTSYIYRWDDRHPETYNTCGDEQVACDWFRAVITNVVPDKHFMIRWARHDDHYLCYSSEPPIEGYLYPIDTAKYQDSGPVYIAPGMIWDYYPQELHPVVQTEGFSLSHASLLFSATLGDTVEPRTISVTNHDTGTALGDLIISGAPPWLIVQVTGAGDSQELINTVNLAAVESTGSYCDTILVRNPQTGDTASFGVTFDYLDPVENPIVVHMPEGGETFHSAQPLTVEYSANCTAVPSVRVLLSPNNGEDWIDITQTDNIPCGDHQTMACTTLADLVFSRYPDSAQLSEARVQVHNYNGAEYAETAIFLLVNDDAGVIPRAPAGLSGGQCIHVRSLADGDVMVSAVKPGVIEVYGVDGRRQRVGATAHLVPLHLGPGVFICRFRPAAGKGVGESIVVSSF